jgi:hypothetical protein
VEVECGVFWYVCNEFSCPKGGEEAIYISVCSPCVARDTHTSISLSSFAWNRDLYSCIYVVREAKGREGDEGEGVLILYG